MMAFVDSTRSRRGASSDPRSLALEGAAMTLKAVLQEKWVTRLQKPVPVTESEAEEV